MVRRAGKKCLLSAQLLQELGMARWLCWINLQPIIQSDTPNSIMICLKLAVSLLRSYEEAWFVGSRSLYFPLTWKCWNSKVFSWLSERIQQLVRWQWACLKTQSWAGHRQPQLHSLILTRYSLLQISGFLIFSFALIPSLWYSSVTLRVVLA